MRRLTRILTRPRTLLSLGALVSGATGCRAVNEAAATTTYNATFVGAATLVPVNTNLPVTPAATPLTLRLTLSQLAATVSGTAAFTTARGDTVLAGGVTGHTTPSGLELTLVRATGCATTLSGPVALRGDLGLSGTLTGADCRATGVPDLRADFALARQ